MLLTIILFTQRLNTQRPLLHLSLLSTTDCSMWPAREIRQNLATVHIECRQSVSAKNTKYHYFKTNTNCAGYCFLFDNFKRMKKKRNNNLNSFLFFFFLLFRLTFTYIFGQTLNNWYMAQFFHCLLLLTIVCAIVYSSFKFLVDVVGALGADVAAEFSLRALSLSWAVFSVTMICVELYSQVPYKKKEETYQQPNI